MIHLKTNNDFVVFTIEITQTGVCRLIIDYDEFGFNCYPDIETMKENLLNITTCEDYNKIFNFDSKKFIDGSKLEYSYFLCILRLPI